MIHLALQDHFKHLKQEQDAASKPIVDDGKKLDLSFKEDQTITINIGKKTDSSSVARQKPKSSLNAGGSLGLLAPPSGKQQQQQSQQARVTQPVAEQTTIKSGSAASNLDLQLDLGGGSSGNSSSTSTNYSTSNQSIDDWFKF